ncbi:MAG: glycosyltransferase [Candidatus Omnitrophica bacterium]|nr:glycosyltransferase [Candidatus Omnitrophota bacterium]
MSIFENIKNVLREIPLTYRLGTRYRAWQQARCIEKEQLYYKRKAKRLGLSDDFSVEEVKKRLAVRLAKRNIHPKTIPEKDLHIVYASRPFAWDDQHIVAALKKVADVDIYYYSEYGFNYKEFGNIKARDEMNGHFVDFIRKLHEKHPIDLILTYMSGYQISPEAIGEINDMGIVTSSFFLDDRLIFKGKYENGHWGGVKEVCSAYDLNLTQAPESLVKYYAEGGIAMLWPLAANEDFFYPRDIPFRYDVSFVGTNHGNREPFINYLRKKGIKVETFGKGWPSGFIPNEKVPEIFSSSRINLNFGDIAYTDYQCGKCRDFEIPMCGALMLTTYNEHLAKYFKLDREIFAFRDKEECLRQIQRLLSNEDLCETVRNEARKRALSEHTWEHRIKSISQVIGYLG